ncbi:MAG: hypothetical protein JSR87_15280 [Proteobacteria bacterium]|nr:hypothetical protein [Pseudomonadota bacterium]MBS0573584.1 hypothetical protein [Pseudomonadota bacterium]
MDEILRHLANLRRIFLGVAEAGFALVALIVLAYILLGAAAGPYVVSVIANLSLLIGAVGSQTLIALAILAAFALWLRQRG